MQKLTEMNKDEMFQWARDNGSKLNGFLNKRIVDFNKKQQNARTSENDLRAMIKLNNEFKKLLQGLMLANGRGQLFEAEMREGIKALNKIKKEFVSISKK